MSPVNHGCVGVKAAFCGARPFFVFRTGEAEQRCRDTSCLWKDRVRCFVKRKAEVCRVKLVLCPAKFSAVVFLRFFFLAAFSGRVGRAEKLFPCRAVCYLRSGDAGPKREGGPWSKFASRYGDSASRSRRAVPAGVLVASGIVESSPSRNGSLPRRRLAFSASECCILFEEGLLAKSALTYSNYFGVLRLFGR